MKRQQRNVESLHVEKKKRLRDDCRSGNVDLNHPFQQTGRDTSLFTGAGVFFFFFFPFPSPCSLTSSSETVPTMPPLHGRLDCLFCRLRTELEQKVKKVEVESIQF